MVIDLGYIPFLEGSISSLKKKNGLKLVFQLIH